MSDNKITEGLYKIVQEQMEKHESLSNCTARIKRMDMEHMPWIEVKELDEVHPCRLRIAPRPLDLYNSTWRLLISCDPFPTQDIMEIINRREECNERKIVEMIEEFAKTVSIMRQQRAYWGRRDI